MIECIYCKKSCQKEGSEGFLFICGLKFGTDIPVYECLICRINDKPFIWRK